MKFYSSKILLFGEHIVIKGAQALVMPFDMFKGEWRQAKENENFQLLQMNLHDFSEYLGKMTPLFDKNRFQKDLKKGLFFESNIPTGYGLGSSGSVVASVYDNYFKEKISSDLSELKTVFSKMESFFHGSSSGIDPLICYINQPIWMRSKTEMSIIEIQPLEKATLFLLDTKIKRSTSPFVEIFLKKAENLLYKNNIERNLFPINNEAIQQMISGDGEALFNSMSLISSLQREYFLEMIPDDFKQIWDKGLSSDLYKIKLCGAGGGGFFLGITKNFEKTKAFLKSSSLLKI